MKLQHDTLWVAVSLALLGAPAMAETATPICTLTPANSIITEGQTLQLKALCTRDLTSINWKMDEVSVTGDVAGAYPANEPIHYTTPVGLGGSNVFEFTVTGDIKEGGTADSTTATVVVKPSSAVVAKAAGSTAPTNPTDATCGTANGTAVTAMPSNGEQCNPTNSKPALAISGPTAFTWSCISLAGGAEANCSAMRGFTVTATGGTNGTVSPASQGVPAGGQATVTASPASGYSATMSSTCGGTQTGNSFTTGPVNANCTVTATFNNNPVNGSCGTASNATPVASAPTTALCTSGTPTSVAAGTAVAHKYTWGCNGANGGTSTGATACSAPMGYMVTTSAGSNGSISAGKLVAGGTTATFTVTPASGYAATVSGCGGSLSGNTYTTGAITGACQVTASFDVAPTGISCNGVSMPGTVVELDTPLPGAAVPRVMHSPSGGNDVYAFKLVVPADFTAQSVRTLAVTKTTATTGGKRVTISECRGDYEPAGKVRGCYGMGTEVTSLNYAINYSTSVAPTTRYCHLTPGKTYWVNVSSRANAAADPNCSSAATCKFYFESN